MRNKHPENSRGDILIVDDDLANLQMLSAVLMPKYSNG